MAKLVDALPSGGSVRKDVQVRILFWAQTSHNSGGVLYPFRTSQPESRLQPAVHNVLHPRHTLPFYAGLLINSQHREYSK